MDKEKITQRIHQRRGEVTRKRRIVWLRQKRMGEVKLQTPKPKLTLSKKMNRQSFWQRVSNFIKSIFYGRTKH